MPNNPLGSLNDVDGATEALRHEQAPGFHRVRLGELLVTALYDGYVPVLADDLHGERRPRISRLLAEAFLDPDGDRHTAVIAFLVEFRNQRILIDAGSGATLGADTGGLLRNLAAAQVNPSDVDHILLTHLHPDHVGGLISDNEEAVYSNATVHVAAADADHWLDPHRAATATGAHRLIHEAASRALGPYRAADRFVSFGRVDEVIPGVRPVNLAGHTPGHTGYLLGEGDATVLFWGDTVHSHTVQLRRPSVAVSTDSDKHAAITARRRIFDMASASRWWVGGTHMPFPGLGHLRRYARRYTWVPIPYAPVQ